MAGVFPSPPKAQDGDGEDNADQPLRCGQFEAGFGAGDDAEASQDVSRPPRGHHDEGHPTVGGGEV